ncbi:hypothetical protein AAHC03_026673 [Spirometra sp. Aus1]
MGEYARALKERLVTRRFADVLTVHYNQIKPAPDCGPPPDFPLSLVPSGSLPPVAQTVEISASNSQGY